MKNHEDKLFSSIGRIDDDILDSALAYSPAKTKTGRTISIKKKITAIALAAVMCMGLVVTVTAYGSDIWAAITQRKRELIDDKSQVINKTVSVESGCSLTIDNVAGGGGTGFFYFSIHSGDEPFTKGLKYERLQVMYKTSPDLNVSYSEPVEMGSWYTIYDDGEGMGGFFANLERIEYDSDNPTSTVQYKLSAAETHNTTYQIVITGITSEDGSIKYADELSMEFDVDLSERQTISQVRFHRPSPEIEFELDGIKYQIFEVSMHDPYSFDINIINLDEDAIEYEGKQFYAVNRFCDSSWYTKEWFDYHRKKLTIYFNNQGINSDDFTPKELKAEYDELCEKESEALNDSLSIWGYGIDENGDEYYKVIREEPYNMSYNLHVELFPDCGASVKPDTPNVNRKNPGVSILEDGEPDMTMNIGETFKFTSPIYITDIKRVYVTKNSDPDFELTIYEPSKDKSLLDLQNAE